MKASTAPYDRRAGILIASFLSAVLGLGAMPAVPASDRATTGSGERDVEEIEVKSTDKDDADPQGDAGNGAGPSLVPPSHHGSWTGSNRLWVMDPDKPFRSTGTVEGAGSEVRYTWTHEDRSQTGVLRLSGPPEALRGAQQCSGFRGRVCLHYDRGDDVV